MTVGRFGAYGLVLKDKLNLSLTPHVDWQTHMDGAIDWLCRAQDSSDDRGVSRSFHVMKGWDASYPETTGYIIPTVITYGNRTGRPELIKRALEAADWLLDVQFPEGGIPGGTIATRPLVPTIFNTGQVVFGWIAAYEETKQQVYLDAARKASEWLVRGMEEDGAWRKHKSTVAHYNVNTYNVRVAWAMLKTARVLNAPEIEKAALKNIDWALTQANDTGWFANNCLGINEMPLTHTIGYTTRGILECGLATDNQKYIDAAIKTARSVLGALRPNGYLPGRLTSEWKPGVTYNCLTGGCQMSIVWCKLYQMGKGEEFLDAARRTLEFVSSTQDLKSPSDGIRGGIKGSYPINSRYGRYEYLNWAAKFFVDALMIYSDITK